MASISWARVRVCVEVDAGKADTRALTRLVMAEVNRHETHQAVTRDCDAHLSVELVELDAQMGGERYLTARLDTEVPAREPVRSDGMGPALERLLTVVLHNDPRRLYGPERDDWIGRTREAFLRRGTMSVGIELYETSAIVAGHVQGLSGVALSGRRELDRIHFGIRLGAASSFEEPKYRLALSQQLLAQMELAFYSSADADTAAFGVVALGLEAQRFQGPIGPLEQRRIQSATATGASVGIRGGVEILRTTSTRFQLFSELLLPTFVSRDADRTLVDQWTPTISIGAGGFL